MRSLLLSAAVVLSISSTGCIASILTDSQIAATRKASGVFNTIGDYELANGAADAGIVQFEGMHRLAPDNEDALFALVQGWVGYGFAFPEDAYEVATDAGKDDEADYNKKRAKLAYDRAIFYGLELISHRDKGFKDARRNSDTMKKWLRAHFTKKEDAGELFWTGYGWMAKIDMLKDEPAEVADLYVAVAMVERSVELDPDFEHSNGQLALAAYHASIGLAEQPNPAKEMFEKLLVKTERKTLMVQLTYAQVYACSKQDRGLYERMLNEVLAADDPDPNQRLINTIAKRRAKRYLSRDRMMACGFDMSAPAAKTSSK